MDYRIQVVPADVLAADATRFRTKRLDNILRASGLTVDPAVIEARLAGLNETRTNNGRFGRQVQGSTGLERDEVQSRLVRKETAPAGLNERLGRMYGVDATNPATADRSVGAGVGRVRTRR
jgi:hypothetical protein